ncbi:MAG: alpha/beta hydrolase family protein [Bryobacteraceae bacterium]
MRAALILLALPLMGQDPFLKWMDGIAQRQLDAREAAIAKIRTPEEARARQQWARAKILELLGGLPDYKGPLNARVTGTLDRPRYVIEKVIFESLPKYYVTANLYRPKRQGKHPGILFAMGHWQQGKPAAQRTAANLAMKGFVVLAYDPVGQGEREQAWEKRIHASLAGGSTTQHSIAGAQSILAGENFARYRIFDGQRALDYLVSRPEVDAARIGCTGCSGGGTLTTYIAALDPRVKVAAPACYINTWRHLFSGPTGDAEQSIPGFLSSGLDVMDYIELFAPKPWLIGSTLGDFFPIEGARHAYQEARRFYRVFGAQEKIAWAIGPGGHGTPIEVREAINEWFQRWLQDGQGDPREEEVDMASDTDLLASETGQVGGRELWEIIDEGGRKRARRGTHEELAAELRRWAEPAGEIASKFFTPETAAKPPVLVVNDEALAARLAREGSLALNVVPRGLPMKTERLTGDYTACIRAAVIGKNLAGLRAADIVRGAEMLAARAQTNEIRAAARGVEGIWLLMAATLEPRIARVWVDRTPYSLRAAMETALSRNLHAAAIPGFALRWDLEDMARNALWSDPQDWMGALVPRLPGKLYRGGEEGDDRFVRELLR